MTETTQNEWDVIRFTKNHLSVERDEIATEYPLTIILNGEEFATMVCSPTNLRELLIGFLASEGVIRFIEEIDAIQMDQERGFAYVELKRPIKKEDQQDHSKRFIGSCCGKSRQFYFKNDVKTAKTVMSRQTITISQAFARMEELQNHSKDFIKTGGVHNAALCAPNEMITIQTDIGRHNALDKVYGTILEKKIPLDDKLITFSGRISSEVLLKVSKIGIGIVISKSAPTDLALKLANDLGITIAGFVRGTKMNIYTNSYRIHETTQL
ncbi:formate dehydrogenase accessory sulfurtransferase FdhD [Virgibacillus alimentarius]|uniref:Sulfur carrier protein FdhD n=1 Tax=Virgibacillus alimentarius TaxID=698769 RepID=A0ABS4SBM3_9BACI|nr:MULTISPECIES: formate dehydrogenase accessory sulfurtransferase FdhD [Virgibacillus]MBP2258899.1 FdhD protein [Virgibacillus alimentarius]HLR69738.1 formate dehydrogenase accessory sulfurtransferase FdhD [Virgibacillus sp.]